MGLAKWFGRGGTVEIPDVPDSPIQGARSFRLGNRQVTFEGISETDAYFGAMGDGVEDAFFNFCRMYLRPDDTAIDVGANIGVTAALMSQCLPLGHVYAFEPAKTVFPVLARNIEANGFANVSIFDSALSDKVGVSHFQDQSAYGHLIESGGHEVQTSTLDNFVESQRLASVGFLKIDVEGYERSVLDGGAEIIKHFNPLIYMEFNSWCLTAHSRVNPLTFVEWILCNFAHVFAADKDHPTMMRKIERDGAMEFLQRNMMHNGFVDDLIITNDAHRLIPQ